VRDIYIGTLDAFLSSALPSADYVALGRIHRPQLIGGEKHIRYCCSPIPLNFDELNNDKIILLVEFDEGNFIAEIHKKVPRFQTMHLAKIDLNTIQI
jgi:exonuclease SbcD